MLLFWLLVFVYTCLGADVLTLTKKNFAEKLQKYDTVLVEFYAPWCGHCQSLTPEYEAAAKQLKFEESPAKLAKVDATKEEDLAKTHGIEGFPTLKLFKGGKYVKDYSGKRTSDAIAKFMQKESAGGSGGVVEEDTDSEPEEAEDGEGAPHGGEEGMGGEGEGEGGGASGEEAVGVINLDSVTWPKFIGSDFDVLVKFDTAYPYGEKENEFIELTKRVAGLKAEASQGFLFAMVGVEDYGDKLNEDLASRFQLKSESFPAFKLFRRGTTVPVDFVGDVSADALSGFLTSNLGMWIGLSGCLETFDRLAISFVKALPQDQADIVLQTEKEMQATDDSQKQTAQYYLRVMQKITEKGADFAQNEALRIERLLESQITDAKKEEMELRLNILTSYGAKVQPRKKKEDKNEALPENEEEEGQENEENNQDD